VAKESPKGIKIEEASRNEIIYKERMREKRNKNEKCET
jgi:hypothetical protein